MVQHPYYPLDLELPNFEPATLEFTYILGVFFTILFTLCIGTWLYTGIQKNISTAERWLICWFVATGTIHFIVEGAVVVNSKFYQDNSGNILNEIWKEYSKADSRYASRDAFIVTMEGVTAFVEGPACFLIVFALLKKLSWRYTVMLMVSLGQLYGCILYFLTDWHDGFAKNCRPEPFYFWFYFIFMNVVWIVIPLICIVYSSGQLNAATARSSLSVPAKKLR